MYGDRCRAVNFSPLTVFAALCFQHTDMTGR